MSVFGGGSLAEEVQEPTKHVTHSFGTIACPEHFKGTNGL